LTFEHIRVEPLTPTIGAEIHGIDLRKPLDATTFEELHRALLDHKVIFFRDQPLTTAEHVAFARHFGELEIHPFAPHEEDSPEAMRIEHDEDHPGRENFWHSDVTWRQEPSLGSVLRAVEVPKVGGDTLFADMVSAYEALPDALQRQISGLTAIHDFTRVFGRGMKPEQLREMQEKYPAAHHPVVRTHPETGRKGIYVNGAFTTGIEGMKSEESESLLRKVYREAQVPEYQCRFRWRPDSIAFWDNRSSQHYAAADYWPARRRMVRVTIAGDRPF